MTCQKSDLPAGGWIETDDARKGLDEELQKLVKKLGEAINDSINESTSVNGALEELRVAGHDAFLVLEATIAFKDKPSVDEASGTPLQELSKEDQQFLRSLNIRLDPEE